MLLAAWLQSVIKTGTIVLTDAYGRKHTIGNGSAPAVHVRLHDSTLHRRLVLNPAWWVGHAYMEGTLTIEEGDLRDLFAVSLKNRGFSAMRRRWLMSAKLENALSVFATINPVGVAARRVQQHYDLSRELYELFLDSDKQYSCAYFDESADDIERAQVRKKQHLASKLLLKSGQRVLDIGCGWGGLAMYLAEQYNVKVTGITISREQYDFAIAEVQRRGLEGHLDFALEDYRLAKGPYDRIVSVGMLEHVGPLHYSEYFRKIRDLLTDDGVALIHTIGRQPPPANINVWMRRNIFPGAYLPSLSQLAPVLENNDLWLCDFENLRLHYAWTLREWESHFQRNRSKVSELYDERFCRMWEFYLKGCEAGFLYSGMCVFQMQIAKQIDALPMTRDYMFREEQRLKSLLERRDTDVRTGSDG